MLEKLEWFEHCYEQVALQVCVFLNSAQNRLNIFQLQKKSARNTYVSALFIKPVFFYCTQNLVLMIDWCKCVQFAVSEVTYFTISLLADTL